MNLSKYFSENNVKQADFCRSIGVSPALLHQWIRNIRPVAVQHCAAIEAETKGVVTRKDMRPDDWEKIWPELATKKSKTSKLS